MKLIDKQELEHEDLIPYITPNTCNVYNRAMNVQIFMHAIDTMEINDTWRVACVPVPYEPIFAPRALPAFFESTKTTGTKFDNCYGFIHC